MNLHGLAHVDAGDGVIVVVLGQVDEEEALAHTVVATHESLVAVEAEF